MGLLDIVTDGLKAVGSFIKGAMNAAVKLCSKIADTALGKSAMAFLGKIVAVISPVLGPLGPIVAELLVRKAIELVIKALTNNDEEEVDEMGYRLDEAREHSDWKKPEDFRDFNEYYEYLKEQIPDENIDVAKLKENRYYYEAIGVSALVEECKKQYGIAIPVEFFVDAAKACMEDKEVQAFIEAFKNLGYESVLASDYFAGKLTREQCDKIKIALINALQGKYPEKDLNSLENRLAFMETCTQNDKFMMQHNFKKEVDDINVNGKDSKYLKTRI